MAEPRLSASDAKAIFAYDPESGVVSYRGITGQVGHITPAGYWSVAWGGARYLCHRIAWAITTGEWPRDEIDHVNGRRDDNRWSNLRDVSRDINRQNMRAARRDSVTGLLGVSVFRGRFQASIKVDGKTMHLGTFECQDAAHAAYVDAKRKLHAGCTL